MSSNSRFVHLVLETDTSSIMIKIYQHPAWKSISFIVLFIFLTLPTLSQEISTDPAAISAGQQIFNSNCKACHRVKQKLIGPALAGVTDRVPSIQWIVNFVHNSSAVIASGDEYAVNLFNEFNKTQMTAFPTLKEEDIMNVLAYIQAEASKVEAAPETPGPQTPGGGTGEGAGKYLNVILFGMVLILLLLIIILSFLISAIKRFLDQRPLTEEEKEVVHSPITLGTITRSPGFIFVVAFIVVALGFKTVINGLYSIGVQQGYAPKQPIAFSHKIHAGQYQIDCQYCHIGARNGKNAMIPSVNICMNCHNQIRTGTTTGDLEINKILTAYNENRPIRWVRIHNLPDLAYFNHSQHVTVGGIACQTCHGPIEEMDVVRQFSLLTMGWCINCHRTTDVNSRGNAYYDQLEKIHKESTRANMKVEDIGGLECSKCHY